MEPDATPSPGSENERSLPNEQHIIISAEFDHDSNEDDSNEDDRKEDSRDDSKDDSKEDDSKEDDSKNDNGITGTPSLDEIVEEALKKYESTKSLVGQKSNLELVPGLGWDFGEGSDLVQEDQDIHQDIHQGQGNNHDHDIHHDHAHEMRHEGGHDSKSGNSHAASHNHDINQDNNQGNSHDIHHNHAHEMRHDGGHDSKSGNSRAASYEVSLAPAVCCRGRERCRQRHTKFLVSGIIALLAAFGIALAMFFSPHNPQNQPRLSAPSSLPLLSSLPSSSPTITPSTMPSVLPTAMPSTYPSFRPSLEPSAPRGASVDIWLGVIRENDPPDSTITLTNGLRASGDRLGNYGLRIRSLLVPPETGTYYLYVAGGGHCELYLSCSTNEDHKRRVAFSTLHPPPEQQQWHKYSSQMSDPLILLQGEPYYVEVRYLYTSSPFRNYITIGWESPQLSMPLSVIDSSFTRLPHPQQLQSMPMTNSCFSSSHCPLNQLNPLSVTHEGHCYQITFHSAGNHTFTRGDYNIDCHDVVDTHPSLLIGLSDQNTTLNSMTFHRGDRCPPGPRRNSGYFRWIVDPLLTTTWVDVQIIGCRYEMVLYSPNCTVDKESLVRPNPSLMPSISNSPSMNPSMTTSPSISLAPTYLCHEVYIFIQFDHFHCETKWNISQLTPSYTENLYAFPGLCGVERMRPRQHNQELCLPQGQYQFTIYDDTGDGICCSEGQGYYNISSNGNMIAQGGDFGFNETITFDIPYICYNVIIVIVSDEHPCEIKWTIFKGGTPFYAFPGFCEQGPPRYSNTQELCLPQAQYEFIIYDTFGDGICCNEGEGFYNVTFNGNVIAQGGEFEHNETVIFDIPLDF